MLAVWNELTPYRLHVLRRIRDEVDVRMINVFTHSVTENSMPWHMDAEPSLGIVFNDRLRLPLGRFFHRNALGVAQMIDRLAAEAGPDFVVMHGHNDLARLLAIRALRRRGIPLAHASDANALDERAACHPRSMLRAAYLRWVLGRMDGYLAMGVGGRAFYRMFGSESGPVFNFPYEPDYRELACRDAAAVEGFRARTGIADGRRHFLYAGRLVAIKRVDLILRAFVRVAPSIPEWDLVIAGDGPLRREIDRLVPIGLADRVRVLGFLQMEDLRHAYRACDVLVHASMKEPWGLVINEAVASGMAVIASDVAGAAQELVKHRVNGFLVRPGSVDDLATGLHFVSDPARLGALKAASERVIAAWRQDVDPIRGFNDAVTHFRGARTAGGRR